MSAESMSGDDGTDGNLAGTDRAVTLHLAAAVVVDHDRVLIVRRSETERFLPNVWGVPCGKIDPGETGPEAVLRELREETGLAGTVIGYLGKSTFASTWRGQPAENIQSNFLVQPADGQQVRLPKQDQAAAWISRDEVEHFDGLDDFNRNVLGQWLRIPVDDLQPASSSMAIASSTRR